MARQGWGRGVNRAGASAGPLLPQTPGPPSWCPASPPSSWAPACCGPARELLQPLSKSPRLQTHEGLEHGSSRSAPPDAPLDARLSGREDAVQHITGSGSVRACSGGRTRVDEEPSFCSWSEAGLGVRAFNGEPEGQKEGSRQDGDGGGSSLSISCLLICKLDRRVTPSARRLS